MTRDPELPEGTELVRAAVHEVDAAAVRVSEAEAALGAAKAVHAEARERLRQLLIASSCEAVGCKHDGGHPKPTDDDAFVMSAGELATIADNPDIPLVWRLAAILLGNPVLDYQATAHRFAGDEVITPYQAKNRINGHISRLRGVGVATTLGSNTFAINRRRLLEVASHVFAPGGAPMT